MKMGKTRATLEMAVWRTAFLAQFLDFPRDSPVYGSMTSMPLSISVLLMK